MGILYKSKSKIHCQCELKFGTGTYKNIYENMEKDPEFKYICPKCDGQKNDGGVRSLSFEKKKKKKTQDLQKRKNLKYINNSAIINENSLPSKKNFYEEDEEPKIYIGQT